MDEAIVAEINGRGDTSIESNRTWDSPDKEKEHLISVISSGENADGVLSGGNVDGFGDRAQLLETGTYENGRGGLVANNQGEFDDTELYKGFQKITTIPAAALSIIVSFIMIASVFVIPTFCKKHTEPHHENLGSNPYLPCYVDSSSLIIYLHTFYWALLGYLHPYLKKKDKDNLIAGYMDFYRKTKNIRRAPFYIVSIGSFTQLMVMTILHDHIDPDHADECTDHFMKVNWIRGLITIECMIIMSLFSYYIIKMREFNRLQMPPDVMRESYMRALRDNLVLKLDDEQPVMRSTERTPEEVAERDRREAEAFENHPIIVAQRGNPHDQNIRMLQAELIRFLIRQIKRKNKKLVALSQQIADQDMANITCPAEHQNQPL